MTQMGTGRRYRFGVFEADAALGELRKQGIRLRVGAQPFQVLTMLLDRPGELVTREEIARELWPDGTFVDFEHGVNSAVNRIREVLGDRANNPRFVETLARRGYRFVAPVERVGGTPTAPLLDAPPAVPDEVPDLVPATFLDGFLAAPEDLPKVSHPVVQGLFLCLQVMYVGFYVGALTNLAEIEELLSPLAHERLVVAAMIVTAALLIPVRLFVITAALMHPPGGRAKLLKLWRFLLPMDIGWSLSPFLLMHHIPYGLALSCMAILVYSPFAQRSLVLMGAGGAKPDARAAR